MWDGLFDKVTYWRNVIYMILITFWTITGLKKKKKKISFSIYWRRGILHICLVIFIYSFHVPKSNSFISSFISILFILQIIVHLIHIHHIWFYSCCIVFQPHRVFHFLNQSHLWKPGVPLDKTLIWNIIVCIRVSTPPSKIPPPQWTSKILKFFILNTILSFKSN